MGLSSNKVTLREHLEALRMSDDRRYAEVAQEREKALRIKEDADKTALSLAREIQVYKDEKANELRSQIESERGSYATKEDLAGAMRELKAEWRAISERSQDRSQPWQLWIAGAFLTIVIILANHPWS